MSDQIYRCYQVCMELYLLSNVIFVHVVNFHAMIRNLFKCIVTLKPTKKKEP